MKNIAIIPARSGSKGLPNKNIRPLNGVPLMAYTIQAALNSGEFDTVMVSTDSEEYAQIARQYGAEVPFLRSEENSQDMSSSWAVVKEVITCYEKLGKHYDTIALLQDTSPLRLGRHISEAYRQMEQMNAKAVVSMCENESAANCVTPLPEDLSIAAFAPANKVYTPRQKVRPLYRINGALYLCRTDALFAQETIFDDAAYAYTMEPIYSVDVDTLEDFRHAEALVQYLPEFKDYFRK